jgi:hypothetical protein
MPRLSRRLGKTKVNMEVIILLSSYVITVVSVYGNIVLTKTFTVGISST